MPDRAPGHIGGSLPRWRYRRRGQALIESCLVILLIGLIFAGLFQLSQLQAAQDVLRHAAARAARAKTVGFNRWMVTKCTDVAAIPNAGRIVEPAFDNINDTLRANVAGMAPGRLWDWVVETVPQSAQFDLERVLIPEYLYSENVLRARALLDYEDWDSILPTITQTIPGSPGAPPLIQSRVSQEYPLRIPLHRAFYAADTVTLRGESEIETHYSLYLEDMNW